MSFTLTILFVRVLDRDFLVHEVLAIHICDGVVRGFEVGEGDEAVTLRKVRIISCNLTP